MAVGRYTYTPRTTTGDFYPAQPVTVYEAGTSALATLWQDDAGTIAESNPVRTTQATGELTFVADTGAYDLLLPDGALVTGVQIAGAGGGSDAPAWDDITDKPTTFPPTIGATATTAVAGNDARLTAGAAATATVRALGTTATTAAAGNDARLLTGTASTINSQSGDFADLTAVTTAYNDLLTALRGRGIIGGA